MILSPGRVSGSRIHHLPVGARLLLLCGFGTGLFFVGDWRYMAGVLVVALSLYAIAGIPFSRILAQMKPLAWVLVPLFLFQGISESWPLAALIVLRIGALVLLAALVTMTTRSDALIEAIERALRPFSCIGVDPSKVGLAFSLALRFLQVIGRQVSEVRDAQRARGLGRNPIALALPLIVRTLKAADEVADAIDARTVGPADDEFEAEPRFAPTQSHSHSQPCPPCPRNP